MMALLMNGTDTDDVLITTDAPLPSSISLSPSKLATGNDRAFAGTLTSIVDSAGRISGRVERLCAAIGVTSIA